MRPALEPPLVVLVLTSLVVTWGRVADPPSRRQLLRKVVHSPELQQFMRRDPGVATVVGNERVATVIDKVLDKSTMEMIREQGYPAEEYDVTTEDGYVLTMHRIPHGVAAGVAGKPRPPVLLQHGLLSSSSDWIMQPPARALAYMLADHGYDVWLGNVRGNTYSRHHVSMTKFDPNFWKFTWDQMGEYDAPAMIDFILNSTGNEKLYWIGHSMGTTIFWVMMHVHPEYNTKVRLMQALGPVARTAHMVSAIRFLAPFSNYLGLVFSWCSTAGVQLVRPRRVPAGQQPLATPRREVHLRPVAHGGVGLRKCAVRHSRRRPEPVQHNGAAGHLRSHTGRHVDSRRDPLRSGVQLQEVSPL